MINNVKKITAIVLTWNCKEIVSECIDSLLKSTYSLQIIVVDNNSEDGTGQFIRKKYPSIKVIQTGSNLGYAGGNNIALKLSIKKKFDYAFIINPDAKIDKNCVKYLVEEMESDKNIGMVSPKMYYSDEPKRVKFAGFHIDWLKGRTFLVGDGEIDKGQFNKVVSTDMITGAAVLIDIDILKKVGVFSEEYFLYFEDTDLSIRFSKAGYKLQVILKAKAWHRGSYSTGGQLGIIYQYYMTRNNLLFMHKYGKRYYFTFLPYYFINVIMFIRFIMKNKKINNKETLLKYKIRGVKDYYFGHFGKQT